MGYCCFGTDARVPGGDYSADALDIGLGMWMALHKHYSLSSRRSPPQLGHLYTAFLTLNSAPQ